VLAAARRTRALLAAQTWLGGLLICGVSRHRLPVSACGQGRRLARPHITNASGDKPPLNLRRMGRGPAPLHSLLIFASKGLGVLAAIAVPQGLVGACVTAVSCFRQLPCPWRAAGQVKDRAKPGPPQASPQASLRRR
jgi:hypothetical protein